MVPSEVHHLELKCPAKCTARSKFLSVFLSETNKANAIMRIIKPSNQIVAMNVKKY